MTKRGLISNLDPVRLKRRKGVAFMKNVKRGATCAAAFLLVTLTAGAQMGMRGGPPPMHGVWHPVVGNGAAYDMETKDSQKSAIEMAVVGKESVGGQDGIWMEITMNNTRMGGEIVMKMLTVVSGDNTTTTRMIMQLPGRPPMEMPSQMAQGQHRTQPTDIRTTADDVGSESVTVPAGTFACEHYRMKDGSGDVWISEKVSPWGMVKFQGKDTSMVLTKVITDAKDMITGTPIPFDPMKLGAPPQQ